MQILHAGDMKDHERQWGCRDRVGKCYLKDFEGFVLRWVGVNTCMVYENLYVKN